MALLNDLVTFDLSRLFNGAVDVDWLRNDPEKAATVAQSFVFHGPTYHAVSQDEVADTGHKLVDTATFALKTVSDLASGRSNPFVLAIAGFGSGKSHLAVTLAELLSSEGETRARILQNIAQADGNIADSLRTALLEVGKVLVVTLNGMNNADLSSALLAAVKRRIEFDELDASPLDNLKGRFKDAANSVRMVDPSLITPLYEATGLASKDQIVERLAAYDESTYKQVREFLRSIGLTLRAFGDETAKDILGTVAQEYIGEDKPYSRMLVLFDEFGHYMEFATSSPHIAGDGALQQLFEGVQGNEDAVNFIGFIQYELKAYEQRLPVQFKNEIRRFITRFDSAIKDYLSSNLETLIASLLLKSIDPQVDTNAARQMRQDIAAWYPISQHYAAWRDEAIFARVIAGGCWPLAPLAMWVLFSLSASGKYLQNRSALTLLSAALQSNGSIAFTSADTLPPVALWTGELQSEFENIEDELGRGVVMQSYNAVLEKHKQHLSKNEIDVLRAIVLLAQTQLKASSKADVLRAIGAFTGLDGRMVHVVVEELEENKNVIAYDDAAKRFDIMGDSASRSQFLRVLRTKAAAYDNDRVASLFVGIDQYLPDLLSKIEGSFAQEHKISTPEWGYAPRYTHWRLLKLTLANLVKELHNETAFMPVDAGTVRGRVIYCYVPVDEDIESVVTDAQRLLRAEAKDAAVLLALVKENAEASISKALIDLDIMENGLSKEEITQYERLLGTHRKKQLEVLHSAITAALRERNTVTPYSAIPQGRLTGMADELFASIYDKVIPFEFDGFTTGRGGAAKDCAEFTRRLLVGTLTHDDTQTMPVVQRNRIQSVLNNLWGVFGKNGSVTLQRSPQTVRALVQAWETKFTAPEGLNLRDAIALACAEPYGANIASAGFLFAAFYQAKRNMAALMRHDIQVSFEAVIGEIFSGNFLNPAALSVLTLVRTEGVNSEWEQFIADWQNSNSYRARVEYLEKRDALKGRIPIPAVLKPQVQALTEMAKDAQKKIDDADNVENRAIEKISSGIEHSKTGRVASGASLLKAWLDRKTQDDLWEWNADIKPLVEEVNRAKQIIQRDFVEWLERQAPKNDTAEALTDLDSKLKNVCSNLKTLSLDKLKEAVEQRSATIKKYFNAINCAMTKIAAADSWLAAHGTPPQGTPLLQLQQMRENAEEQVKLLKDARADMKRRGEVNISEELSERINKISTVEDIIKNKEKEIKECADAMWKTELTVETAQDIVDESIKLLRLYEGSKINTSDFFVVRDCAQTFIEFARRIDNLQLTDVEFEMILTEGRENIAHKYADEELPWDLMEIIGKTIDAATQKRKKASLEWAERMSSILNDANKLSVVDLEVALKKLSDTPPYFNDIDSIYVDELKSKIKLLLEYKGIEWLVEKFKQLTPSGKKQFMYEISKIQ